MKSMVKDHNESVSMSEMKVKVLEKKYERQCEEFDRKMTELHDRIDKAEKDRMHKYYGQVSEISTWVISVKQKIEDSAQMCEALRDYFPSEHQIFTMNQVAETLSKCLEGRSLNMFVDEMREKQDRVGKRKMRELANSASDKLQIATRFLKSKQPFHPMPTKIADEDLPLTFEDMMLKLTKSMESARHRPALRGSPEKPFKSNRNIFGPDHMQTVVAKRSGRITNVFGGEPSSSNKSKHRKSKHNKDDEDDEE